MAYAGHAPMPAQWKHTSWQPANPVQRVRIIISVNDIMNYSGMIEFTDKYHLIWFLLSADLQMIYPQDQQRHQG
jgi:hypothetical protein